MNTRYFALVLGIVYAAIGLLGFVPGLRTPPPAGAPELAVAGGYGLINMFLDNFVQPMLLGRRFGLSILVVVLCVLFWGWLWGLIGIVLAVPLTMILKVVLDNSDEFRWIAVAIGQESPRNGNGSVINGTPPDKAAPAPSAATEAQGG